MTLAKRTASLLGIIAFLLASAALLEASDNSTVNYGANQSVTAHSTCRTVTNNSGTGLSVYVPTQTSAEWASFYGSPPSGVAIGSCGCSLPWGGTLAEGQSVTAYAAASAAYGGCVSEIRSCTNGTLSGSNQYASCSQSCGGTPVGGYCWYLGPSRQSCNSVCSSRGGCNLTGTRDYAGSGGTNAQCSAVAGAFGLSFYGSVSGTSAADYGCYRAERFVEVRRVVSPATTCSGVNAVLRFCACNQ